ncbi:MAG: hypothetical protein ABSC41_02220 [Acidimicrobiales bacterium]|jgi:lysophospholipase L1-like esterase
MSRANSVRAAIACCTVLSVIVATAVLAEGTVGASGTVAATAKSSPLLGVLGATRGQFVRDRSSGVDVVTIAVGWNDAEPTEGRFSVPDVNGIKNEIDAAKAAGLGVILDPGLQYPPNWVFSLPGGTRFVNQYGNTFTGSEPSGNNVANAVTDASVRGAESTYLAWLGSQIPGSSLVAVRQGGGPLGELRYPDADYDGHTDSYWAYDASTQAASPVPGWVPGTGTIAQAAAFLIAYNAALDDYGIWLNGQLEADFGTKVLVMLPGWGERPGGALSEVSSLLTLKMDEFNEGLDWNDLLDALPDASHSVAYTTYLDAPTVRRTLQLEDPANFLATLVAGTSIRLGGENTGNGTVADMELCAKRAKALDFFVVQWMDEAQLMATGAGQDPGGPTLRELGAAIRSTS